MRLNFFNLLVLVAIALIVLLFVAGRLRAGSTGTQKTRTLSRRVVLALAIVFLVLVLGGCVALFVSGIGSLSLPF
jgi:uncharacterized membrane protein YbjE (DUF340 family)